MHPGQAEDRPTWQPMGEIQFEETSCPICHSDNAILRYTKNIRGYPMKYYICSRCRALYANPRAGFDSLKKIYASADFFEGGEPGGEHLNYFNFIGGEKYLRKTARDRLSRIQRYCKSGKMLEGASAAGFFLAEAKTAGFEVTGVEISAPMAEYASKRWSVDVIPESIEQISLPEQEYDVIATWGLMTIIRDPIALIRKFHQSLKPGGIWAFNTYYYDGWWSKLFGSRWQILVINFSQIYTKKLILEIVRREGFRLLSRRRDYPHTDLLKVADQMSWNLSAPWLARLIRSSRISNLIIRVPLPDVMEYIWQKV